MSEKIDVINIEFKLDNLNGVTEGDTDDKQPEKNHYRKIQETEEGQQLIIALISVINSIKNNNIEGFIRALKVIRTNMKYLKQNIHMMLLKLEILILSMENKKM